MFVVGGGIFPQDTEGRFTKAPDAGAEVPELFGIKAGPPVLDLLCFNCSARIFEASSFSSILPCHRDANQVKRKFKSENNDRDGASSVRPIS